MTTDPDTAAVVELLRRAEHVVVPSGAGASAESGMPTFRDALAGLWARFGPADLATLGDRAAEAGNRIKPVGGILFFGAAGWLIYGSRWKRRIARREAAGHCVRCGYDLRASPDRCPECGAAADRG